MSDSTLRAWPAFSARVHARLEAGARAYPERPTRSELELLEEISQELEDVAGWSCVLWSKLEAIKARLGYAAAGRCPAPGRNGSANAPEATAATSGHPQPESASEGPFRASNGHPVNPNNGPAKVGKHGATGALEAPAGNASADATRDATRQGPGER